MALTKRPGQGSSMYTGENNIPPQVTGEKAPCRLSVARMALHDASVIKGSIAIIPHNGPLLPGS
ncbi:hypothetical protein N7488_012468 [Penicillium malachiteum]|nr:hypothetical protein N7488_012468 [Penicillium malachiteum]